MKLFSNVVVLALLLGSSLAYSQPLPMDPLGDAASKKLLNAYAVGISSNSCSNARRVTEFTKHRRAFMKSSHAIDLSEWGVLIHRIGDDPSDTIQLNFNNFTIHHPYDNFVHKVCSVFEKECLAFLENYEADTLSLQKALKLPEGEQTVNNVDTALSCEQTLIEKYAEVVRELRTQRIAKAKLGLLSDYYQIAFGEECTPHMMETAFEEHGFLRIDPRLLSVDLSTPTVVTANVDRRIENADLEFVLDFAKLTLRYPSLKEENLFDCLEKKKACLQHLDDLSDYFSDWKKVSFGDVSEETEAGILGSINCAEQFTELFTDFVSELD